MKRVNSSVLGLGLPVLFGALLGACSTAEKQVEEKLNGETIATTIKGHLEEIKTCFGPAAKANPKLEGLVRTSFVIGSDGKVMEAEIIESTLNHKETEICIAKAVESWKFPEPPQGQTVEVKYPFLLRVKPEQVADHMKRYRETQKPKAQQ